MYSNKSALSVNMGCIIRLYNKLTHTTIFPLHETCPWFSHFYNDMRYIKVNPILHATLFFFYYIKAWNEFGVQHLDFDLDTITAMAFLWDRFP